jgi:hydrogenase-4 component F
MPTFLLLVPLVLSLPVIVFRRRLLNRAALIGTPLVQLAAVVALWIGWDRGDPAGYLVIDSIGLLFLTIMTFVFLGSSLYSLSYFKENALDPRREAVYVAMMLLFVAAMTGVLLAADLALLWVFVEATTLTSAVLIYFEKKKSSLEAAWKYIFICSIGIALAFVGIIVLSVGSRSIGSLAFADLYRRAGEINPFWLKMAFAFILVGFGTKIGVAPIHAWLPDAHSEAPSPVSALLSGALLNATFLGLLRVHEIMIRAGLQSFSNVLLLVTGFLSLLISAAFMLHIVNYKRMLAYSSIENMGILFLGVALGAPGVYAALLHSAAHSLAKASLFLTSGTIVSLYGSKRVAEVRGLLQREPRTGWLWLMSMLAISGAPPFPSFLSKFLLVRAFFAAGTGWMAAPFLIFVTVIFFGMGGAVTGMAFGEPPSSAPEGGKPAIWAYAPQWLLLALLLGLGLGVPAPVQNLIQEAAAFLR